MSVCLHVSLCVCMSVYYIYVQCANVLHLLPNIKCQKHLLPNDQIDRTILHALAYCCT